MAYGIGVVGGATTGKSTGLRNLNPKEVFVISPFKANMPIPGYTLVNKVWSEGNLAKITDIRNLPGAFSLINSKRPDIKYLVVEDITHYFNAYTMSPGFRSLSSDSKKSWSRWGDFGADVFNALFHGIAGLRDDLTVINHFHTESVITAHGEAVKIKSPGNLLEKEVDIPSYFDVMLYTDVVPVNKQNPQPASERYRYVTNNDGYYPAKSPLGMFDEIYIPNDMALVIKAVRDHKAK